jgi:hypothetical protein
MTYKYLLRCFTILLVPLGLAAPVHALDKIRLRMVPAVQAPVIVKKSYRLTIDFLFNRCPQEHWIFYDRAKERLIVEFFGISIDAPPAISVKGTSVVSDLAVVNGESNSALNGKVARLSMALQQGWHYESKVVDGKVLRVQLWMPLNPTENLEKKKPGRMAIPIILITAGVAGLTSIIIFAATHTGPFDGK